MAASVFAQPFFSFQLLAQHVRLAPLASAASGPSLTDVQPAVILNQGVYILALTGTGFSPGAQVTLSSVPDPPVETMSYALQGFVRELSPTEIKAVIHASGAPLGKWAVTVSNPDGQKATLPSPIQMLPPEAPEGGRVMIFSHAADALVYAPNQGDPDEWGDLRNWGFWDGRHPFDPPGPNDIVLVMGNLKMPDTGVDVGELHYTGGTIQMRANTVLRVRKAFQWSSGTIRGGRIHVAEGGTFRVPIDNFISAEGTQFMIEGDTHWNAGNVSWNHTVLTNKGVFEIIGAGSFQKPFLSGDNPLFVNEGILRKRGDAEFTFGEEWGGTTFISRGSVDVEAGKLTVPSGMRIERATLTGSGVLSVSRPGAQRDVRVVGTVTIDTNLTIETFSGFVADDQTHVLENRGRIVCRSASGLESLTLNIHPGGVLEAAGPEQQAISRANINNAGQFIWSGSGAYFFSGATVRTTSGGVFEIRNDALIDNPPVADDNLFVVEPGGVLRKTGGSGETILSGTSYSFGGMIDVQSGIVNITRDAAFQAGLVINGAGSVRIGGGATIMNGAFELRGRLDVGTATLRGSGRISGNGTLSLNQGTLAALNGEIELGENLRTTLVGTGDNTLTGSIRNAGVFAVEHAGKFAGRGGRLHNQGRFEINSDAVFESWTVDFIIENSPQGEIVKENPGTTSFAWMTLDNAGKIRNNAGALHLNFTAHLRDNSSISGPGITRITDKTRVYGSVTFGGEVQLAGELVAAAPDVRLLGPGGIEWLKGSVTSESGFRHTFNFERNLTVGLAGSDSKYFGNVNINNAGHIVWRDSGNVRGDRVTLNNLGTFEILNSAVLDSWVVDMDLRNAPGGLIVKRGSTGVTQLQWVRFRNEGTLAVESGEFVPWERYTAEPAGRYEFLIRGASPRDDFGVLNVEGTAGLGGTLALKFASGFEPAEGQVFTPVAFRGREGSFQMELPSLPSDLRWDVKYNDNALALSILSTPKLSAPSVANGTFAFTASGSPAAAAIIESSTDLQQWTGIETNRPFSGTFQFVIPIDLQSSMKFFRLNLAD